MKFKIKKPSFIEKLSSKVARKTAEEIKKTIIPGYNKKSIYTKLYHTKTFKLKELFN